MSERLVSLGKRPEPRGAVRPAPAAGAPRVYVETYGCQMNVADSDLLAQGGTGAQNTVEVSLGAEFTPDPRRPSRRPIRFGARYGTLPFTLVAGEQPHEVGVSLGTGLRFAQDRAGVDVGVEHVWRSEGVYSERTFLVNLGVSIRP